MRQTQRARSVSPKSARRDLYRFQARDRAGSKAILFTDVADFYPSIYTHSIPWAFHTKAAAKANTSTALFGNKLDQLVRNAQDRQTMGIPIGPDTSFIIAEAILASLDAELMKRIPSLRGLRWIDEYELTFTERAQAEEAFAELQHVLLQYELRLNPRKTKISDLPAEFVPEWVSELRRFRFRNSAIGQANDLIRYFDLMTTYLASRSNEHVVKYGIARLRTFQPHASNRDLFQSLLCQCIAFEPGAIREAIEALYYSQQHHGLTIDHLLLEATINTIIEQNATVGHDYEVSWCLWAALTWSIRIGAKAAAAISGMENSVVAILALDAHYRGLFGASALNAARWYGRMTPGDLYDEQWLLSYEANVQGWLPTGQDHVSSDAYFGFLKAHGVRFYTPTSIPIVPGALAYP